MGIPVRSYRATRNGRPAYEDAPSRLRQSDFPRRSDAAAPRQWDWFDLAALAVILAVTGLAVGYSMGWL